MGLKEVLSRMKLVELSTEESQSPMAPPSFSAANEVKGGLPGPPTDIRDLLGTMPEPPSIDESKLPDDAEEDIPDDFGAIYKAAGVIDPAHGYTCYKVLEIFASPGFTSMDTRSKASALTGFLNMNPSGPVPVTDIVQDAVRRDQALDKFEEFMRAKLVKRNEEIDKENAALQGEIDEVIRRNREKIEANRIALETEQAKLSRWQVIKRAEERKLFDAVNPFVESNPISTADTAPRPGAAPAAPPETGT